MSGVEYRWVQGKCRGALHCQTISNYVFFSPTRMNHSSAPPTGPGPGLCPQFQMVRLALVNEDLDVSTRSLIWLVWHGWGWKGEKERAKRKREWGQRWTGRRKGILGFETVFYLSDFCSFLLCYFFVFFTHCSFIISDIIPFSFILTHSFLFLVFSLSISLFLSFMVSLSLFYFFFLILPF